jgi:hypothetical protein
MQKPPQHEINPKTNIEFGLGMGASTSTQKLTLNLDPGWGQVPYDPNPIYGLDRSEGVRSGRIANCGGKAEAESILCDRT